ncbi:MAG: valine--tRNA ligase [Candidatus Shapirobacteria bacterium]|nr:valine--tRNA ligase [Candidatus Shapirobacteria bacterium]
MEKTYEPQKTEPKIYELWEKGGYFQPRFQKGKSVKKPFIITLPPPNVTGELHLGHAMYAIEDLMIRYHRMLGEPTLWLPGFDHASIAVEYLVTKELKKEGKTKKEIGREEFLKKAKDFAENSKNYIKSQLISLGFSLDWTRETYTMDKQRSLAVKEAFKKLYDKGLIYQGERIINWCPKCQTALSDLENDYEEEEGELYYIKYGLITIATTRPETMFADVALAVNPKDKRYTEFVDQKVPLPLTDRQIPIITDEAVDPKFGTGVVKVTPGHDPADFEIGQRHHLEIIHVINQKGKLTEVAGRFAGMNVLEAREAVVKELEKKGDLIKVEKIMHNVGHCQRCGTITEPMVSKQWFIKTQTLAKPAIEAVKNGEIKIIPQRFEKVYLHWLENIKDWCISRQLWWGHKIPLEGQEDVLDTWFSSGLWPFATLGWPEKTDDFKKFFPTTVRETGYDIIFFWVAREIMLSLFLTGKVPYEVVYFHGLVRDKHGQKMSKTKGNTLDPLQLTQKYGTDALRMSLIMGNSPGNDLSLSEEKVKAYRNFANKVWNASRFILDHQSPPKKSSKTKHSDDKWILDETNKVVEQVTSQLNHYRFDLAADNIYQFFWHTFCDQYLEMTKKRRDEAQETLLEVLALSLKLLHPFMPFLTEQIWQLGKNQPFFSKEVLIISPWPKI